MSGQRWVEVIPRSCVRSKGKYLCGFTTVPVPAFRNSVPVEQLSNADKLHSTSSAQIFPFRQSSPVQSSHQPSILWKLQPNTFHQQKNLQNTEE
jgi:hypothetical protein